MWRVGRTSGRTLYKDDVSVGRCDTPEIAAEIVALMNAGLSRAADGTYCHAADPIQSCDCPEHEAEDSR